MFPTAISDINARISKIDPEKYASTRNFADGSVTRLSPYISRGVISTKHVYDHLLSQNLPWYKIEKIVQELSWRDYWQQVWIALGDDVNRDIKNQQEPMSTTNIPSAIQDHATGIEAIDQGIKDLYETGYMHNHMRMYVAALACNVGQAHWLQSAKWMYSHLLDGDWASNALSWQWVAGTNANKKYYANQDNINRYFHSTQMQTYLDIDYEDFEGMPVPPELKESIPFKLDTKLPSLATPMLDKSKETLIYNYYNLDPKWHENESYQRVLLLEPSFFKKYPVQNKCIDFILKLAENIRDLKVFVAEYDELQKLMPAKLITYKEHPTNSHYQGTKESREWMFDVSGYYPSFFAFWKKCKKQIGQ